MNQKITYSMVFSIVMLAVFLLISLNNNNNIIEANNNSFKYSKEDLRDSKKVITDSFIFANEHNLDKLRDLFTSRYSNENFRLDNLASTKLIELKVLEGNYSAYFDNGRGRINNIKRKNLIIYRVKYYIKFKDQTKEPFDSGVDERDYCLIRENNAGNWKIDEIGIGYFE